MTPEQKSQGIDFSALPKTCYECKCEIKSNEWIISIGQVGALSASLIHQVSFTCRCGHKMYSGILKESLDGR